MKNVCAFLFKNTSFLYTSCVLRPKMTSQNCKIKCIHKNLVKNISVIMHGCCFVANLMLRYFQCIAKKTPCRVHKIWIHGGCLFEGLLLQ